VRLAVRHHPRVGRLRDLARDGVVRREAPPHLVRAHAHELARELAERTERPRPVELVQRLVQLGTARNGEILDERKVAR